MGLYALAIMNPPLKKKKTLINEERTKKILIKNCTNNS